MKRRKLFYIPGLISIVGLPILLYFLNPDDIVKPTVVKLALPSDQKHSSGGISFTRDYVYSSLKNKKVISVDLSDFEESPTPDEPDLFEPKLHFITREIERLAFTNDTMSVLKVEFGDQNTYGQWMWVLNNAKVFKLRRYVFVDNKFYFFANPAPVHYQGEDLIIDLPLSAMTRIERKEPTKWEIFMRHIKYQWEEVLVVLKYNSIYVIGFVLLILIPGIRLIARPRVQRLF